MLKLNFKTYSCKSFLRNWVNGMKKILFGLLLFLIMPICVSAADYDITDFLVKSQILENGDLEVNELIVLKGDFNGYERDLKYANRNLNSNNFENNRLYNASDITDVKIAAKKVSKVDFNTFSNQDFQTFEKVLSAFNGSVAKYTYKNITNGYSYRMYYPSNDEKVAFYLTYTVKDAVVMHEDVAELYWTFIPDGFEDELKHIEIEVYLPNNDNSDNFRIWAHGNLSGEVNKIDNNGVKAKIDSVLPTESVDIRLTFDKSLISNMNIKKSNTIAMDKIIEVETKRADVANSLRKELLRKYNFVKYGTIGVYISIIILGVFIYFKYGKSPKSGYYSKYNREFIDDYNVEVIDYLMKKSITPNAMSASIMNLIYKKNISAEEMIEESKKDKNYKFTLESMEGINESEKILIEFLFDKVGKGLLNEEKKKTFTTKNLKAYARGVKTCDKFISSYTKWKNNVLDIGKKEEFYQKSGVPIVFGIIILIISFIIFAYGINYGVDFIPTFLLLFFSIAFLMYCILIDKKTMKGSLHYDKWKAFKNFLNDFGSFELKELPEIVLWERYLVYATIFGLADKVEKSMNVHIKEIDMESYDYYPSFVYINMGHTINTSINNALSSAYSRQAANYSNSHSSSSSGGGFGGGFSSGGGFGGGGGGGRGF